MFYFFKRRSRSFVQQLLLFEIWTEDHQLKTTTVQNVTIPYTIIPHSYFQLVWCCFAMVDVTAENFEKLLPNILADIKSAVFVAVDSEFTGLSSDDSYYNR